MQGGAVVDKLEGADAAALTSKVATLVDGRVRAAVPAPPSTQPAAGGPANGAAAATAVAGAAGGAPAQQDVAGRIKWLLSQHPVLLFMKVRDGVPLAVCPS